MKNITYTLIFILLLLNNNPIPVRANADRVSVYLDTGEIIKGELLDDSGEFICLKRNGLEIDFDKKSIIRIETEEKNKKLSEKLDLPYQSAVITYKYSGSQQGQETLIADFKNNKFMIEKNTTDYVSQTKKSLHQLMLYNGSLFYLIDLEKKMGLKMKAQQNFLNAWFGEKALLPNFVKKELYNNHICNVYENGGNIYYYWRGILIKQISAENIISGAYIKEISDLQFDVPIPDDKFMLPEKITIKSMDQIFRELEAQTKSADDLTKNLDKDIIEISAEKETKLLALAKNDPELQAALKQASTQEGRIDFTRILDFLEKRGDNNLIEKVAALEGGIQLLEDSRNEQGQTDIKKLRRVFSRNEEKLKRKRLEIIAQSQTLIDLGNVYLQEGKYADALEKFTKAIELNPTSNFAYYSRAQVYEAIENYLEAIEDFSAIIQKQGDHAKYWDFFNRGNLYQIINEHEVAIEDYKKALKKLENIAKIDMDQKQKLFEKVGEDKSTINLINFKANEMANVLMQRALSYKALEDYKRSLADLNKAVKTAVNETLKAKGYFLRGLIYKQLRRFIKMEQDWEKAKSLGSELREGEYKYRKKQGLFIWYYPNGIIKITGNYDQGKEHGFFRWYFPNGKIETEGEYINGIRQGLWNWYDQKGNITQHCVFKQGKISKNKPTQKEMQTDQKNKKDK